MLLAMGAAALCGVAAMGAVVNDEPPGWDAAMVQRSTWLGGFVAETAAAAESWGETLTCEYQFPEAEAVAFDAGLEMRVVIEIGADWPALALVSHEDAWQGLRMPLQGCPPELPAKQIGYPVAIPKVVERPPSAGPASTERVIPSMDAPDLWRV